MYSLCELSLRSVETTRILLLARVFACLFVYWQYYRKTFKVIILKSINEYSTHSLMRKDLTGHIGPNGHLHMAIIKLKKDKTNIQNLW